MYKTENLQINVFTIVWHYFPIKTKEIKKGRDGFVKNLICLLLFYCILGEIEENRYLRQKNQQTKRLFAKLFRQMFFP